MNLKEWREQQGLTQTELGEKLGLSKERICGIEHGRSLPTERTVRRRALRAGMDPVLLWVLVKNCERGNGSGTATGSGTTSDESHNTAAA
jgi:hypothetical protein